MRQTQGSNRTRMGKYLNRADPSYSDSHFVLFDVTENLKPDFVFVWDSKSNAPSKQGLEMSVLSVSDGT